MRSDPRPLEMGRRVPVAVFHAVGLLALAAAALPLLFVLNASLRPAGLPPARGIEILPTAVTGGNYAEIFALVPMARFLGNSALLVAVAVPLTIVAASFAGFAMARLPAHLRRRFVIGAILLMLVPPTALWLTRFVLFRHLGLIDSLWALAAPAIMGTSPLFVLLYYWGFRRIPGELFDAATLDGVGVLRQWRRIAMPLAKPSTIAVAVLAFIFYWNDFFGPLLYLKSESKYTVPVGLQILQQMDKTNWPLLMAAAAIMTAPTIAMFILVQRYFWPDAEHR